MGLDCFPVGRPRPEHAEEWAQLIIKFYDDSLDDETESRLLEITIAPHADVGAPTVGIDEAADEYVLKKRPADSAGSDVEFLAELHGYNVLALVKDCDGLPKYSMGFLSTHVDETSLRRAVLQGCFRVLPDDVIHLAWSNMAPNEAVRYGEQLLALAAQARAGDLRPDDPKPASP